MIEMIETSLYLLEYRMFNLASRLGQMRKKKDIAFDPEILGAFK